MAVQDWFKENQSSFSGSLSFDEPLFRHTYYRIGGPASVFTVPKCQADIQWLNRGIRETGIPFFILGLGSNILFPDEGYPGLIIRTNRYNLEIQASPSPKEHKLLITTGASVPISTLLRKASQEGWDGLEFLTGVPGSVGGAIRMNAGTHLGAVEGRLQRADVFIIGDGVGDELKTFNRDQFQFAYRKNLFLPEGALIWSALWEVEKADPEQVKTKIAQILARRKQTQPIDMPSCGSVFKNPKGQPSQTGLHAWQVIERLGLRGFQIGQAQFSEKHCNFIVNLGSAKASDVRALIDLAKTRAKQELNITLEEEVIVITPSP